MPQPTFNTLEEIQLRKEQLQSDIHAKAPQPSSSKGELIASLVTNSITAIDGFLLVRKLMKTYGWLFKHKKKK